MKFIFADSLDVVDPGYDFEADTTTVGRKRHWDERYPHELMNPAPYDGVLVSRSIVGDHRFPGKYSFAQAMRFRREGARKFLRLDGARFKDMSLFGDSGAFSYVKEEKPPYTPAQMLEFYSDAGFTHGCSVDHVIFEFERETRTKAAGSVNARQRFDITLENARAFLRLSRSLGSGFTPVGVAQGWSPSSLAKSARALERMGYTYIALGGLVPLRSDDIHRCLSAVREHISPKTRIHLLGFAKAEQIGEFARYAIESFDSTSPLIRAFKDARSNYYVLNSDQASKTDLFEEKDKGLRYYAAIRIPQALENTRLTRAVKEGKLNQEDLLELERRSLDAVRGYERNEVALEQAVDRVADYGSLLAEDPSPGSPAREKLRESIRVATRRTLEDRPWSTCDCAICQEASIEVMIFRSSNRNKRRGFHNLGVFFQHVQQLLDKEQGSVKIQVPRRHRTTERRA